LRQWATFNYFSEGLLKYQERQQSSVKHKQTRLLKIVASFLHDKSVYPGNQFTFSRHVILDFNLFNLRVIVAGIYLAVSQL
jgi:hypothetical protein